MKIFTTFCLLLILSISARSQSFVNSNGEDCFELYKIKDSLNNYIVYLVFEDETEDTLYKYLNTKWKFIPQETKSKIVQKWAIQGRRIESEFLKPDENE